MTTRKGMVARTEAAAQLRDWTTAIFRPSLPTSKPLTALELTVDAQLWDGVLIATVERAGCDFLLSEDMQDGARFGA